MTTTTTALIFSSATEAEFNALYLDGVELREPAPAPSDDFEWIDSVFADPEQPLSPEGWEQHQREHGAISTWYALRCGKPVDPVDALVGQGLASYLPLPDNHAAALSEREDQSIDAAVNATLRDFDGTATARERVRRNAEREALRGVLAARSRYDDIPALCGGMDIEQHDPAEYDAAFPRPSAEELAMREEILWATYSAQLAHETSRRSEEQAYLDEFHRHGCWIC